MKTFLILLLCAIGLQSFSQLDQIILSGGVGKAMIFGGDSWKDPLGLQVSVETKFIELNENASVSAGLGVSFQGAGWEEPEFGDGKVNLAYLNVPVIFNFETDGGFYGEIGLQPGFLLSAKDKYDGTSEDWSEWVNGFEVGVPFGAGYRINEMVSVGARATYGITKLNDYESDTDDHNFIVVAILKIFLDLD